MITTHKQAAKLGAWLLLAGVVAAAPMTASALATTNTVTATVNPVISITTAIPVAISLTPTVGGVVSSQSDIVTVNTNNTAGYVLTLANSDATSSLVSGANTITAHTGTFAAPTALANGKWGYAVAAIGGFDATYSAELNAISSATKWAGVPAIGSPQTLKTTAAVAIADTTTVWYGVRASATQPTGAYTDTVTYTATTN